MRKESMVPALALVLVSIGACEPDRVTDAGPGIDREVPLMEPGREAVSRSLGVVATSGGAVVGFHRLETGHIVVSELVPTGALSPMDALMTAQRATPLEMFLALAPGNREVPAELEEAHAAYAAAHRLAPAPRRLNLNPTELGQSVDGQYNWKYAADCDLADDGGWFDWFWQTFGWNWHWYWRTNSYNGWSPTTPKRVAVQTHLCNDGPSGNKIHRVMRSSCGSTSGWDYVFTATVPPEYRSQFRVWDGPTACHYAHRSSNPIGSSRYPTFSYGITTP